MNRAGLYTRVSTKDKGQSVENQLRELREYCKARQFEVVREYCDNDSGARPVDKREDGAKMLQDAYERKFDVLIVWALDRLTREGMFKVVEYILKLDSCGVSFHSLKDSGISSDNKMSRNILLAAYASLAEAEHDRIVDRVTAGLERAKEKGVRLGAPPKLEAAKKILKLKSEGLAKKAIAKALGLSRNTVRKYWPAQ